MNRVQRLALPVALAYLWIMMLMLGAIVLETFMIYPNIFRNAPESLAAASSFFSEASPATFFRPIGMLSWICGVAAAATSWPVPTARRWLALSLLCIMADGVASMLFFWPRNTIMFIEGAAVHSPEVLRQTAAEFETLHWLRVTLNAASAGFAFAGFVALDRWQTARPTMRRATGPGSEPARYAGAGSSTRWRPL